jgi:hypothetical protein
VTASIAAAFSSGWSNIQRCRRLPTPSPNGFASLWFGPAAKPSTEIAMSHVTLLIERSSWWLSIHGEVGPARAFSTSPRR